MEYSVPLYVILGHDEACFMHLTPGSGPPLPKGCRCIGFLSPMRKEKGATGGQPQEFWSLVSIIDGSTLPQDCVEDLLCGNTKKLVKHTKKKSFITFYECTEMKAGTLESCIFN